jgi:hypothetical protein
MRCILTRERGRKDINYRSNIYFNNNNNNDDNNNYDESIISTKKNKNKYK